MNGAKFCWSFQQTRLPVVQVALQEDALPGQVFVGFVRTTIVASRPLPDESIAVAPPASSKRYDGDVAGALRAGAASAATSAAVSARS